MAWVAQNLAHSNYTQSAKCNDRYNKPGFIADQDCFPLHRRMPDAWGLVPDGWGLEVSVVKVIMDSLALEKMQVVADFLRRNSAV